MTNLDDLTAVDVCVDCYFAHHYGATRIEREATEAEAVRWRCGHDDRSLMGLEFTETEHGLMVVEWFAGESDTRCEGGEPLHLLEGLDISDWTYDESNPENADDVERYGSGHTEFTRRSCQGCGCTLGGSRERLAIHPERPHASDCKCSGCHIPHV